jgi:CheY-like chemotaxis protein
VSGGGTLLLVEDDPEDARFALRAFSKVCTSPRIQHVVDGMKAQAYLEGRAEFADRLKHPLPSLILLDVKLPQLNGFELLEWMRSRPEFEFLPVIMLSSSQVPEDVARAKTLGALEYHVKPVGLAQLERTVEAICRVWTQLRERGD